MRPSVLGVIALAALSLSLARAEPIRVVAAESVYGDLCHQIGGDYVAVVSILASPDQDPHEFEASASTARAIAQARLVVFNGAGYDAWMTKLLAGSPSPSRVAIELARVVGKREGDNPHLWYDAQAVSTLAAAIADALSTIDPAHRSDFVQRRAAFDASMQPLFDRIADLRKRYAGTPVTATEPVFGYMSDAIGLAMRNARFQLAMMNETEPAAKDIAAFEHDLKRRAVRALIYNRQTRGPLAERMLALAKTSGVAVVGVTETQPPGSTYVQWMLAQLDALDRALSKQ